MSKFSKTVNRIRQWLGREAVTVGISPKVLAAPISAGIALALNAVGLTPQDISDLLGISTELVLAGEVTVAGLIAAWLLPPGNVVTPQANVGAGSDAALDAVVPPAAYNG